MKILQNFTKKNLVLNKKRSTVTIIGIALAVSLIVGLFTLISSLQNGLLIRELKKSGPMEYSFYNVPIDDIKYFAHNRNIKEYYLIENLGYIKLAKSDNLYKPYGHLVSVGREDLSKLDFTLVAGRLPETENEIVLSNHLKTNGGVNDYQIGNKYTFEIGKRTSDDYELTQSTGYLSDEETFTPEYTKEYTVVGYIERPSEFIEDYTAPGYTFITCRESIIVENNVDIHVKLTKNGLKNRYSAIANLLGVDTVAFKKRYSNAGALTREEEKNLNNAIYKFEEHSDLIDLETFSLNDSSLVSLYYTAFVIVLIIIGVSVFCIRNSFNISITEKVREYGMLKSIGATSKQIKATVFYEAFLLAIIGLPLGILAGILGAYILTIISNQLLSDGDFAMSFAFKISLAGITISLILSFLTIFLSSLKSAIVASRTTPINSIRNTNFVKNKEPKLTCPKFIKKLFGVGGAIAYKSGKRNKSKYRTTVISIVVCITAYIGLSYFMTTVFHELDSTKLDYNIAVSIKTKNDDILKKLTELKGINRYSILQEINFYSQDLKLSENNIKYNNEDRNIIRLVGVDEEEYLKYIKDLNLKYDEVKDKALVINRHRKLVYGEQKNEYVNYDFYDLKDTKTINGCLIDWLKERTFTCLKTTPLTIERIVTSKPFGLTDKFDSIGFAIVRNEFINNINDSEEKYYTMYVDAENPNEFAKEINELNYNTADVKMDVSNYYQTYKKQKNEYLLVAIFLYGFITMVILIGVTNIFNTITTAFNLRKSEFATLKSIGMTNKEFRNMIFLEGFFYCFKALVIGIPLGILLSLILFATLSAGLVDVYELPLKAIIISTIVVFIFINLLMHYSLKKTDIKNLVETIKNENI